MFEPFPLGLSGGRRSDRHGVIERHPTLALSRSFLDPRDIAAHGAVEEHRPQISALRHQLNRSSTSLTARAGWTLTGDKLSQMLRQEAGKSRCKQKRDDQAIAPRSGRPRLRRLLQSRGGLRSRLEGRPGSRNRRRAAAAHSCRWRFLPGEVFQFDQSEDWAIIGGERTKLQVAHFKLCHSRAVPSPGSSRSRPMRCCSICP